MKVKYLAAAAVLATSAPAFAQAGPTREMNPWQDCGIGAMIFPDNGVAAAISNIIWDLGTTAVSSNLSSPEQCSGTRVNTAIFINTTYSKLETETALGEGEYLAAMANMMACEADARPVLFTRVRADMGAAMAKPGFAELSNTQKAEAYFNVVDAAAKTSLAGKCYAS